MNLLLVLPPAWLIACSWLPPRPPAAAAPAGAAAVMLLDAACHAHTNPATAGSAPTAACHAHNPGAPVFAVAMQRDNFDFFITMGMGLGNRLGGWVLQPSSRPAMHAPACCACDAQHVPVLAAARACRSCSRWAAAVQLAAAACCCGRTGHRCCQPTTSPTCPAPPVHGDAAAPPPRISWWWSTARCAVPAPGSTRCCKSRPARCCRPRC